MKEYEVNCINKPDRDSPHHHITHIGHRANKWCITMASAVARIEAQTEAFYLIDKSTRKRVYIAVVREHGKPPFLRSYANGSWNDNLLALPECGPECG